MGEVVRELKIKPSKEIFVLCQRCSECLVSDVGTLIAPPSTDLYKVSFSVELVFGGQEMVQLDRLEANEIKQCSKICDTSAPANTRVEMQNYIYCS